MYLGCLLSKNLVFTLRNRLYPKYIICQWAYTRWWIILSVIFRTTNKARDVYFDLYRMLGVWSLNYLLISYPKRLKISGILRKVNWWFNWHNWSNSTVFNFNHWSLVMHTGLSSLVIIGPSNDMSQTPNHHGNQCSRSASWIFTNRYYNDVIMGAMTSQVTSLTIVYSTVYSGAHQRKKIKAPRHWPLCGEFTGDRWTPHTNGQQRGNVSIWWRHPVYFEM